MPRRRDDPEPVALIFGNAVRAERERRDWTIEQLGERMGRPDGKYLGEIERGYHSPTLTTAKQIADALEVQLAELVQGILGDSLGTAEQFDTEMEALYEEMKAVLPSPPTTFLRMLKEHGGVEAARRLVDREQPTSTFLKLVELGHPEWTVESLVLRPQYSTLFSADVKSRARGRLPN